MLNRLTLPFLLTVCLMQSTLSFAGEFLEAKSYSGCGDVSATADFNGDGHLDLAISDFVIGDICIVLGNPDGSFQQPVTFSTTTNVDALAIGDFNGDGKPDVVTITYNNSHIRLLLGNGDGTLQAPLSYVGYTRPQAITVTDANGDGNLDVITANKGGTVTTFLGTGDGKFLPSIDSTIGGNNTALSATDFNNDGTPDVLVAAYNRSVALALGNGDGTFGPAHKVTTLSYSAELVVADFNRDGNLDFLLNDEVFLGKGDGSFQPGAEYTIYGGPFTAGDVNGDGYPDLVGGGTSNPVLLGNGDGTFSAPVYFGGQASDTYVAIADVNGDGKADLIGTANGFVDVLLGLADGRFIARQDFPAGNSTGPCVAADFNGDAKNDVAVVSEVENLVYVLLGNGDGTLPAGVPYNTGVSPLGGVVTADMNGDGKQDLVLGTIAGASILLGKGDGTFKPHRDFGSVSFPYSLTVGDFNHDGRLDVAVLDFNSATVDVFLGNGDGTLQSQVNYTVGSIPIGVVTGDFNKDGALDLVVTNSRSDSLSVLFGNGDGSFQPQVQIPTGAHSAPGPITVADLNQDGNLDLAFITSCSSSSCFFQASVRLGNGDGTFAPEKDYEIPDGYAPKAIATADVNSDGNLDLITGVFNTGQQISVLAGNGDGTFQPHVDYGGGGFSVCTADFNGDGAVDIGSVASNFVSLLLNTGGTLFNTSATPNPVKQGQPVTFTVSVAASVVGQPIPTGTVTFTEGSKTISTLALKNGQAKFTSSKEPVGTHIITATYSGDTNFIPNTAKPITLVVQP